MSAIDPTPKRPPAYSPNDARFWDEADLDQEIHRIFDICHSCRMCLAYCPSFPDLFARVDGYIGKGKAVGAEKLDTADIASVVDNCFQCKLCYIKCPYTDDEGHAWLVDYPRIAMREKALRARRHGVTLQDKILGEPQLLGELTAGPQARIANLISAQSLLRKVGEKTAGISAKFPLPPFAVEPFQAWMKKHRPPPEAGAAGEVTIFASCYGDYNVTAPSIAAVHVLEKHGYRVLYAENQTCCGMPNLDGGDVPRAQEKARQNVSALLPHVQAGRPILVPNPTCSMTLSKELGSLVEGDDAKVVAAATWDLMKWVDVELRRKKKLNREFTRKIDKIGYHAPCHLRAQKIAFPAVQLLEATGAEVELVQECSAVDGTWGMKSQYYETGRKYAQRLLRGMRDAEAQLFASDCPLAALRIAHELGSACKHPIEILAWAYGFPLEGVEEGAHAAPEGGAK
ncbi:MAG: 4Fe-4S dicluster domain-containing protein [Deltaproteobacteria bacterium]|nr:4Fe-4S dicluster domain-containing protein [Deltaproteobacteria bacterium]